MKIKGKISWNQEEYFKKDALRTTSTLESWHRQFNKKVNFTNPTLEHLFSNLQLEQCRVEKVSFSNDMGDNTSLINQASLKRYVRVKEIAQEPYSQKKCHNT